MPGVPLDALSTMKKGIKGMFRKKSKQDSVEEPEYLPNTLPTHTQHPTASSTIPPPPAPPHAPRSSSPPRLPSPIQSKESISMQPPLDKQDEPDDTAIKADEKALPQQPPDVKDENTVETNQTLSPLKTTGTPNVIITPASAEEPKTAKETFNSTETETKVSANTIDHTSEKPVTDEETSSIKDEHDQNTMEVRGPVTQIGDRSGDESPPPPMQATSGPLEDNPILT